MKHSYYMCGNNIHNQIIGSRTEYNPHICCSYECFTIQEIEASHGQQNISFVQKNNIHISLSHIIYRKG